jgi:hypothetical protein
VRVVAVLLATALAARAGAAPDRIDLGGNATLFGRVVECSAKGVRIVPAGGGAEELVPPSAVVSVVRADGQPCNLSSGEATKPRGRSIVPGVIALVVLPVAGAVLGTAIAKQTCQQSDDQTPCLMEGFLIGIGSGLVIGSVVLVGSALPDVKPPPGGRAQTARSLSLALRF